MIHLSLVFAFTAEAVDKKHFFFGTRRVYFNTRKPVCTTEIERSQMPELNQLNTAEMEQRK